MDDTEAEVSSNMYNKIMFYQLHVFVCIISTRIRNNKFMSQKSLFVVPDLSTCCAKFTIHSNKPSRRYKKTQSLCFFLDCLFKRFAIFFFIILQFRVVMLLYKMYKTKFFFSELFTLNFCYQFQSHYEIISCVNVFDIFGVDLSF